MLEGGFEAAVTAMAGPALPTTTHGWGKKEDGFLEQGNW